MATPAQWLAGARPRTLPAAVVPVAVGTGAAVAEDGAVWWRALLALFVALALQVGVNYANDYSDGVKGTDKDRVGPLRLVGSGVAAPKQVLAAALGCFLAAAVAGLVLVVATRAWWLLLVGLASILAAWFYTGGSRPYGYRALGEISVFVFFGLVAVAGTTYVQVERLTWLSLAAAVPVGLLACALLMVNNLRDIVTDGPSGKRTLAVVLGDSRTRLAYSATLVLPFVFALALVPVRPFAALTVLALPLVVAPIRTVRSGATGPALIATLQQTGRLQLVFGALFTLGLALF
ncbi:MULTISPECIES: 1,4-dihydroxy-2-naphthoate polyprenyltransferase [Microbispora]|uniref:1,4-dihydroxy-2-naphthoate octaprenyltransferase n=1 Tax=Microbispora siamensis TaxID=564413 RepID=A0ABQ4GZM7_9ACTN|nr:MULTISPECIES: 1,4-dihydroxy-2-naphthoate polyprenyltransferase [Microbispora]MBE3010202.1 1,4-dihydroxy-2-naphthoate polyprenyltransferase [Microbispora sitophila]OPG11604.1 1,4-dihydroxy-2-naphthoate polyprenyltransferase [Microbispora sp. GKU 823]GIH66893.1 1,4-dihydroxy-2-naphthoate octaprenyltransferase [Microbispora siamensis]